MTPLFFSLIRDWKLGSYTGQVVYGKKASNDTNESVSNHESEVCPPPAKKQKLDTAD